MRRTAGGVLDHIKANVREVESGKTNELGFLYIWSKNELFYYLGLR
jgi:hypothetical protein